MLNVCYSDQPTLRLTYRSLVYCYRVHDSEGHKYKIQGSHPLNETLLSVALLIPIPFTCIRMVLVFNPNIVCETLLFIDSCLLIPTA